MRIDLEKSAHRPWYVELSLSLAGWLIGTKPGPVLVLSYRRDLLGSVLRDYILRGISRHGAWSKGESELFATFISSLNACHF